MKIWPRKLLSPYEKWQEDKVEICNHSDYAVELSKITKIIQPTKAWWRWKDLYLAIFIQNFISFSSLPLSDGRKSCTQVAHLQEKKGVWFVILLKMGLQQYWLELGLSDFEVIILRKFPSIIYLCLSFFMA